MKKAPDSKKLSKPTNILRRVLSKTTAVNTSNSATKIASLTKIHMENTEIKPTINVEAELLILKQQINSLQVAVNSMQHETEKKEVAIANLAREKERLASDLRKQQRSYTTLKQQLEEERDFYYKEKEQYCQEMNDCKKLKKSLRHGDSYKPDPEYYKKEITKLKETLTQTLEANYNLSVKFLRMKNTKYCIKNRLKKLEIIHENCIEEYNLQMEVLKSELVDVVDKELQYPIPPSNKKYLQIIKQNGVLTHENLCLRLDVDRLHLEIERLKMLQIRNDTNNKLQYINSKTRNDHMISDKKENWPDQNKIPKSVTARKNTEHKKNRILSIEDSNNDRASGQASASRKESEESVSKLYGNDRPGILNVTTSPMLSEATKSGERIERLICTEKSKFEVVQLSENPSQTSTQISDFSSSMDKAVRTQSAPEIIQTSLFVNDT